MKYLEPEFLAQDFHEEENGKNQNNPKHDRARDCGCVSRFGCQIRERKNEARQSQEKRGGKSTHEDEENQNALKLPDGVDETRLESLSQFGLEEIT